MKNNTLTYTERIELYKEYQKEIEINKQEKRKWKYIQKIDETIKLIDQLISNTISYEIEQRNEEEGRKLFMKKDFAEVWGMEWWIKERREKWWEEERWTAQEDS